MQEEFKSRRLGDLLDDLIEEMGLSRRMEEVRAVDVWRHIAGEVINRQTEDVTIREGRMWVKIRSDEWRHTLHFQRTAWRDRLNEAVGKEVVSEIVFSR